MFRVWNDKSLSGRLRALIKAAGLTEDQFSRNRGQPGWSRPGTPLDRVARLKANGWAR